MLKRIVLLSAALLFMTVGAASAQDPYAGDDTAAVSDTTVEPGEPVTISVRTFLPGSTVTFTFFFAPVHLGTATADAQGVATLTFTVPEGAAPGTHTVEASGTGADGQPLTVTTTLTVVGAGGAAGGGARGGAGLPTTGSDSSISMTQLGLAALLGGGLLVLAANKRRSKVATPGRETAGV